MTRETLTRSDPWTVGGVDLGSRVLLGTSRYPSLQSMLDAVDASGAEVVTVSVRRADLDGGGESMLSALRARDLRLLPNTAGCYTAREAVFTAQLAREALETDWVKLEVIGDDETLYPDAVQTLKAASDLVADGFEVFAYCGDDPITARKLADLGCAAVMPLAAPIGSGMGLVNPYTLRIIRELLPDVSLVVDAGIGTASDAARAMEIGYDGVLLNTAVSGAKHPAQMAAAIRHAVTAGRLARSAGRIPRRLYAQASTPDEGRIEWTSERHTGECRRPPAPDAHRRRLRIRPPDSTPHRSAPAPSRSSRPGSRWSAPDREAPEDALCSAAETLASDLRRANPDVLLSVHGRLGVARDLGAGFHAGRRSDRWRPPSPRVWRDRSGPLRTPPPPSSGPPGRPATT